MIAATPIVMPMIENQEKIEMNPSVFLEKRKRLINNISYDENNIKNQ